MLLPPEGNALSSELRGRDRIIIAEYAELNKRCVDLSRYQDRVRRWSGLLVVLLAAGCGALAGPDTSATLQAENQQIVAEATTIAEAASANRVGVQQTADAAETTAAGIYQDNLRLRATVEAAESGIATVGVNMDTRPLNVTPGQPWFQLTGLSAHVDQSTGCVLSPQIAFSTDVPIIYMTFVAHDARSGMPLSVSWEYEGTPIHTEDGSVPGGGEQCLWFSIEPGTVDLLPGHWIVRLIADGVQVGTPMAFAIRQADEMQGG